MDKFNKSAYQPYFKGNSAMAAPPLMKQIEIEKDRWEKTTLGELCEIDPPKEIKDFDKQMSVSFALMNELKEQKRVFTPANSKTLAELSKGGYSFYQDNDVILAKMSPCFENGKSGIALNLVNGIGFGSTEFFVLRSSHLITPEILYQIISNNNFLVLGGKNMTGTTTRKRLIKRFIKDFPIALIPLSLQKQLSNIFVKIENQIEASYTLENDLKALKKGIMAEVFAENKGEKVKFGEVAKQVNKTIDYKTEPISYYVAGEHMETDELKIKKCGRIDKYTQLGSAFKSKFEEGQILYGSRRTYLRKVALADFDGVCANTTFVIDTKDRKKLSVVFLAYLMQSERFTQYSILNSKGSTNPYINFKDLNNFVFHLPNSTRQAELVTLFQHFDAQIAHTQQVRQNLQALKQGIINTII